MILSRAVRRHRSSSPHRANRRPGVPRVRLRRVAAAALSALGSALAVLPMAPAAAQSAPVAALVQFDIPAQPLATALTAFARQSGLQLVYAPEVTDGKRGERVAGAKEAPIALNELLRGTGLRAHRRGSTWVIDAEPAGPATESTLPVVLATAQAVRETATGPVQGYVARRSATATKTDTPVLEVPQSVSVIGRDEMTARGAQDVMEIIRYSPGVSVNQYGFDNRGWEDIVLRGFSSYTSTYRDGLVQSPFDITYYLTEPYALERVEVLRGPSSMVFGQGDAGGVIHRVSKMPSGERIREVEVQYGSFDRKQLAVDLGDALGPQWSYRLVGVILDSNDQDRYPDGHELNRQRRYLAPSLRWQPTASTSITLLGEVLQNRSPEDAYFASNNGVVTGVKMGDYSFSGLKQDQNSIGYRLESGLTDHWTLRQNFRYSHITFERRVVWVDAVDADGHTLHRVARTWNDPQSQAVLDTHLQGTFRTASTAHTVLLGVDWQRQQGKALRFIGTAPDLDFLAPVYGQPVTPPTDPLADHTQTTRQLGVYVQDQMKIDDRWVLTLGGRQDRVRQHTDDRLNAATSRQSDSAFSSRAGLSYQFGNGWAPYVSYAESFLPNAGVDAGNNPYRPSRGKQVEAGVKFQPPGASMLLTAAVYDLRKTNVVSYDPVTFEGRQIGELRSRGLELEAKGELMPGLNGTAAYTWLDTRVRQSADPDEIGKRPPGVPKQVGSVWLDYAGQGGFGVGAGVRYVGGNAGDEHNTAFTPGYTLVDAAVHQEWGAWRVALNVSNLFDRAYLSTCYHGECYRGIARSMNLTAKRSF